MRIRRERKKAKLTQMQLAGLSGLNQSTISRLEKRETLDPSFEVLQKLAWALQKCGRQVYAADLHPRRQPVMVKGFRSDPKRRRTA